MREAVLSELAQQDLFDIAAYLKDAAGVEIARAMVERLAAKCTFLATTDGQLGRSRPELQANVRGLPVLPYVLFFRYRDDRVEIVRILHGRRDAEAAFGDE